MECRAQCPSGYFRKSPWFDTNFVYGQNWVPVLSAPLMFTKCTVCLEVLTVNPSRQPFTGIGQTATTHLSSTLRRLPFYLYNQFLFLCYTIVTYTEPQLKITPKYFRLFFYCLWHTYICTSKRMHACLFCRFENFVQALTAGLPCLIWL